MTATESPVTAREQTRARYPDEDGYIERDGVRVFYEVYGTGEPTVLLLPTWSIIHSRHWKAQIPYLARHARVITFDGRGNGRSDRPRGVEAYDEREFAADALAVMDATGTEQACIVGLSAGVLWGMLLAAEHPERVAGAVFIAPGAPFAQHLARVGTPFDQPLERYDGWAKYNLHHWRADYRDFLEFFFGQVFTEPHSTKQFEDCVGWGLETDPDTLALTYLGRRLNDRDEFAALCRQVVCPVLVMHGTEDAVRPVTVGEQVAEATGGRFVALEGAGHCPHARDPVRVNLLIREFAVPRPPVRRWTRSRTRPKRALYLSSPIGLGHARRDIAIARELRRLHPDLQIDWLAQHPVTAALDAAGETVHPGSAHLANESHHMHAESVDHDLHCFQAWRRMDEILVANFMVFHDVVTEEPYDLWIADEGWEIDYYLHENPEQKRAAYAWLTDFVGWLPMPEGGEHEAALTADYNAEMIEHIARLPRVRDRAIFVGDPEDVTPERFGPGLPDIPTWTSSHFEFPGYVTGFDATELADRERLRAELGYGPDEQVCVVAVGGSGVGRALLTRVIAAFPEARQLVPRLRMIVVAGPRIDPASLPANEGLELRAYVPDLYRHLGACDLAVVQGGLTTTMELTAARRPFLYFPLQQHFEQNLHVPHRLDRYGAGRRMDYATATPSVLAEAIAAEIGREVDYVPVASDGAAKAAARLAELL